MVEGQVRSPKNWIRTNHAPAEDALEPKLWTNHFPDVAIVSWPIIVAKSVRLRIGKHVTARSVKREPRNASRFKTFVAFNRCSCEQHHLTDNLDNKMSVMTSYHGTFKQKLFLSKYALEIRISNNYIIDYCSDTCGFFILKSTLAASHIDHSFCMIKFLNRTSSKDN